MSLNGSGGGRRGGKRGRGAVLLLTKILKMEEGHVDWAEIQRAQIEQLALDLRVHSELVGWALA